MNALPSQTDILSTPDFWLLLLCSEFMGEDRFREFLESMKNEETSDTLEKGERRLSCLTIHQPHQLSIAMVEK